MDYVVEEENTAQDAGTKAVRGDQEESTDGSDLRQGERVENARLVQNASGLSVPRVLVPRATGSCVRIRRTLKQNQKNEGLHSPTEARCPIDDTTTFMPDTCPHTVTTNPIIVASAS